LLFLVDASTQLSTPYVEELARAAVPSRGLPMIAFSHHGLAQDHGVDRGVDSPLRRTFLTNLSRLGVLPHIKEELLNHITAKSDVEAI